MLITKYATRWFSSRKLELRPYQPDILSRVAKSINDPTVLAAAPNSGKTYMSICFIDWYLEHLNPNARVLVLTHGTSVLRTQYADDITETNPKFSWQKLETKQKIDGVSQVVITLPHTINHRILPKFDLIIVDEAHQFYSAKMVQSIIDRSEAKHQLLLTGTPSPFVLSHSIIPITLGYLLSHGYAQDISIDITTATYALSESDFNQDGDVMRISQHLMGKDETLHSLNNLFTKTPTLARQKTMYVCKNISQARDVGEYLQSKGVPYLSSDSESDIDSVAMNKFKDGNYFGLVVVNRGILGYSYPKLQNVVDLTCSRNIDRLFQLLCRLVRVGNIPKSYIKLAPSSNIEYYKYIMTCVLCMADEYWYTSYTGTNQLKLKLPVIATEPTGLNLTTGKIKEVEILPFDFAKVGAFEFFSRIDRSLYNTTLNDVRVSLGIGGTRSYDHITDELAMESALKYPTMHQWEVGDFQLFYYAKTRPDLLARCTAHMTKMRKLTDEICLAEAKNFMYGPYDFQQI